MRKFIGNNKYLLYAFIIFISLISLYPIVVNAETIFPDVGESKYRDSIEYLYDKGVVQGYPNGTFGPELVINRAEIMKIILESSVEDAIGTGKNCFDDVYDDRFAKYICYAKEHDMVKGYTDGTFKPMQQVIVAEALKMGLEGFSIDINKSSEEVWYQPYVEFVHKNNIFSKYALLPNKNMTRGEMAYFVHQLMLDKNGSKEFTNQRNVDSFGCGKEPPNIAPTSSIVNGQTRNYITVIGNKYNKNIPMKIIFAFHGRTNPNTMVRTYYDIEKESQGDAIIIYPSGLPEEGPSRNRSNPGDKSSKLRDFALFDQLLKEFENNYCINKDQVFVVGHSLGAWFANSLSCARGDIIRGVGSVGGGTTINNCNGPVAAMIMQNPDDNLSSYGAGVTARDQMLRQNSCGEKTVSVGPEGGNCVEYVDCQKDAPVIWCPHSDSTSEQGKYYPHTWPDFAGETIWNFFDEQK
ncbi:MAG: S-layer homology domain-containing protein [Candidatus Absconditicoccaceae bacterium]